MENTKIYFFNTTIQFASGKIEVVKDNIRHYSEELARECAIKYNEDRGFKVLNIELA